MENLNFQFNRQDGGKFALSCEECGYLGRSFDETRLFSEEWYIERDEAIKEMENHQCKLSCEDSSYKYVEGLKSLKRDFEADLSNLITDFLGKINVENINLVFEKEIRDENGNLKGASISSSLTVK